MPVADYVSIVSSSPNYQSVTNVSQNNAAQFACEFRDSNGNFYVPNSATLNIIYPLDTVTTASISIAMTLNNQFYTATWQSSVSGLGLATWSITSSAPTAMYGKLRIISP